jgi:FkbM family methyltransferase
MQARLIAHHPGPPIGNYSTGMLKSVIKEALELVGIDVQIIRHWPNLHFFMRSWKKLGLAPKFVIDIGANHGDWTRIVSSFFPAADFLMIEPQERLRGFSRDLLARPNIRWQTAGVGDVPGRLLLSIPSRDDAASFLEPESAGGDGILRVEVDVTTLNDIHRLERRMPDMVKIDAEGFDMRVLRGASDLFGGTEIFFIECTICATGPENTLLSVCSFMDANGYRPADFTDLNRNKKNGSLVLCEIVFIRKNSPLWSTVV